MPQKSLKGQSGKSSMTKRKNVPAKRKKDHPFNPKSSKNLNKSLEAKAAAKAIRNESKFHFSIKELNDTGKQRLMADEKQREKKKAKKRSSTDRQAEVIEKAQKRSKNDLE